MTAPRSILVVGAGLAGARCAETLRAEGYGGRLVVVGDETLGPYERPALSKEYLAGLKTEAELLLRPPARWIEADIDLRLGERVVRIDPGHRRATTSTDVMLDWDVLVLATGARPRRLPFPMPGGVHTLRTVADARGLRADLAPGTHLVIVGGGFVGAEVASSARDLGSRVTMLETLATPFEHTLGRTIGRFLADRYRSYGVDLRLRTAVVGFGVGGDGGVHSVRLSDGDEIECDAVLVGIGVEPAAELVPHPVRGVPIYMCGDVTGGAGHWTSAASEAVAVARRILALPPLPAQPAFFWSDQFGLRLQLVGDTRTKVSVEFDGQPDAFVARYLDGGGRLVGALAANRSSEVAPLRRELAAAA